nr:MAG TPA_asm: hypothetical protein [Caudoviricetes sp.]
MYYETPSLGQPGPLSVLAHRGRSFFYFLFLFSIFYFV